MWSCWEETAAQGDGGRRGEREMRAERKGVWGAEGWGKGATLGKGFASRAAHIPSQPLDVAPCSLLSHIPPMAPSHSQDTDVKHIPWAAEDRARPGTNALLHFGDVLPAQGVGLL